MSIRKTILAAAAAFVFAAPALAGPFMVETNKTEPLRLKRPAASIVVGNPMVADVAVFNEHLIFVTGKSVGTTNLIIFDAEGNLIFSSDVSVTTGSTSMLRIVRGNAVESYDCAPNCRSVLNAGDDRQYFENVYNQNQSIARASDQ